MENTLKQSVELIEEETKESVVTTDDFTLENNNIITDEYFEKTCEEIKSYNFIEIKKVNAEFKFQKDSIEKAKESVEQIMELKKQTRESAKTNKDLAEAIMEADAEISSGTNNIEAFLESYDDTVRKLDLLIEKSEERIREFDDIEKTSSYLNTSMIEIIDKNIKRLESNPDTNKHLLKYYEETKKIFSNRNDITFIADNIASKQIQVRRLKTSLKKDPRKDVLKATQKKVNSLFTRSFKTEQLAAVEHYLKGLFEDEDLAFYFQYVLSLIYERELAHNKYGSHKWVEVLFMNIVDIIVGTYDLEGGKEDYEAKLLVLRDKVKALL